MRSNQYDSMQRKRSDFGICRPGDLTSLPRLHTVDNMIQVSVCGTPWTSSRRPDACATHHFAGSTRKRHRAYQSRLSTENARALAPELVDARDISCTGCKIVFIRGGDACTSALTCRARPAVTGSDSDVEQADRFACQCVQNICQRDDIQCRCDRLILPGSWTTDVLLIFVHLYLSSLLCVISRRSEKQGESCFGEQGARREDAIPIICKSISLRLYADRSAQLKCRRERSIFADVVGQRLEFRVPTHCERTTSAQRLSTLMLPQTSSWNMRWDKQSRSLHKRYGIIKDTKS